MPSATNLLQVFLTCPPSYWFLPQVSSCFKTCWIFTDLLSKNTTHLSAPFLVEFSTCYAGVCFSLGDSEAEDLVSPCPAVALLCETAICTSPVTSLPLARPLMHTLGQEPSHSAASSISTLCPSSSCPSVSESFLISIHQ